MLGQRFLLTSYQKKLYEVDYQKHMKRLDEIQKAAKKKQDEERELAWRSSFNDQHHKFLNFQTNEKVACIDKDNQVLLDKLVKISRNQKPPLFTQSSWTSHPGTLNTPYRKKELERIAAENEAMAKRLISQQGSVNRKKLKVEFQKHQDLVKQVQKITSPKANEKLSPLKSPKSGEEKAFKIKKKKKNNSIHKKAEEEATVEKQEETDQNKTEEAHPVAEAPAKEENQTEDQGQEEVIKTNEANEDNHHENATLKTKEDSVRDTPLASKRSTVAKTEEKAEAKSQQIKDEKKDTERKEEKLEKEEKEEEILSQRVDTLQPVSKNVVDERKNSVRASPTGSVTNADKKPKSEVHDTTVHQADDKSTEKVEEKQDTIRTEKVETKRNENLHISEHLSPNVSGLMSGHVSERIEEQKPATSRDPQESQLPEKIEVHESLVNSAVVNSAVIKEKTA